MSADAAIELTVNGVATSVPAEGTLLDALREYVGVRSPKDGCSPQGQCGCCTVWVDGRPRVACVTPTARVAGREVTTLEGFADADRWAEAFTEAGASQCGFCTPGIIMRLAALGDRDLSSPDAVRRQLLAHLCRCTGWQTIVEAATGLADTTAPLARPTGVAVSVRAVARATIEGGVAQDVLPAVALGAGGFADDVAPGDALVAMRRADGAWAVAESVAEARAASGKVQGRRSTAPVTWPVEVPDGDWVRTLRTTWVEPGYLEPDASWCAPGGTPANPLGNGGAFGGKVDTGFDTVSATGVADVARRLADEHGRPVRVLSSREDVVRLGPKRPPLAIGVRADGSGIVHVARTPGIVAVITGYAPGLDVVEVDVVGPPTSSAVRGAGWAEVAAVLSSLRDEPDDTVESPSGAAASARIAVDGSVHVRVRCGVDPTDDLEATVLRSYCIGAAHMALGWVRSEAIAVGADGVPVDLTIRSFGILRAVDTPAIHVELEPVSERLGASTSSGSDAVFAAVAAAAWRGHGFPDRWPARDGYGRVP